MKSCQVKKKNVHGVSEDFLSNLCRDALVIVSLEYMESLARHSVAEGRGIAGL